MAPYTAEQLRAFREAKTARAEAVRRSYLAGEFAEIAPDVVSYEPTICYLLDEIDALRYELAKGAAGARDETALLDAAARYRDAWRVLAAGDATEDARLAHILDMHEAREDLFDAVEVALRAGGAGEEG